MDDSFVKAERFFPWALEGNHYSTSASAEPKTEIVRTMFVEFFTTIFGVLRGLDANAAIV